MQKKGISVIVCCYNSDWIIDRCLNALEQQIISKSIPWEIIIVNNSSTDNTENIVKEFTSKSPNTYHIVHEQKPGLLYARICGIKHAQYSYTIFCDDDNLLSPHYLEGMFQLMEKNPKLGAIGGKGIGEYLKKPDSLIINFLGNYAIGSQKKHKDFLYGAGICVRTCILANLYSNSENFLLTGRCGNTLLAGDDSEMVKQIILKGYQIDSTDDLTFVHVLPEKRLNLSYLIQMQEGFGLSSPVLCAYNIVIKKKNIFYLYAYYIIAYIRYIKYYFSFKNPKRIVYLRYYKYFIKGFHFWGIKKLKALINRLRNEQ